MLEVLVKRDEEREKPVCTRNRFRIITREKRQCNKTLLTRIMCDV